MLIMALYVVIYAIRLWKEWWDRWSNNIKWSNEAFHSIPSKPSTILWKKRTIVNAYLRTKRNVCSFFLLPLRQNLFYSWNNLLFLFALLCLTLAVLRIKFAHFFKQSLAHTTCSNPWKTFRALDKLKHVSISKYTMLCFLLMQNLSLSMFQFKGHWIVLKRGLSFNTLLLKSRKFSI